MSSARQRLAVAAALFVLGLVDVGAFVSSGLEVAPRRGGGLQRQLGSAVNVRATPVCMWPMGDTLSRRTAVRMSAAPGGDGTGKKKKPSSSGGGGTVGAGAGAGAAAVPVPPPSNPKKSWMKLMLQAPKKFVQKVAVLLSSMLQVIHLQCYTIANVPTAAATAAAATTTTAAATAPTPTTPPTPPPTTTTTTAVQLLLRRQSRNSLAPGKNKSGMNQLVARVQRNRVPLTTFVGVFTGLMVMSSGSRTKVVPPVQVAYSEFLTLVDHQPEYVNNVRMMTSRYEFELKVPVTPEQEAAAAAKGRGRRASAGAQGEVGEAAAGGGEKDGVGRMKNVVLSLPSNAKAVVGGRRAARTPTEAEAAAADVKAKVAR